MKKLGTELARWHASVSEGDDGSKIARRTARVQVMFKESVQHLYKDNAQTVLNHVNAVYITNESRAADQTSRVLTVYMDDGNFRSDIHSQQHFLLLWIREHYGEEVDGFRTYPSRFGMRQKHPYRLDVDSDQASQPAERIPLSRQEFDEVIQHGSKIENDQVRKSFIRASIATREWEKGENLSHTSITNK